MSIALKQPCDEGVILAHPKETPCKKSAEPWILAATILGSSMAFIDGTIVNVALPALQMDLNASVIDVQWVVESYLLFLCSLILVGGSLGDQFGRKLIFAIGVGLFGLASVLCGLVRTVNELILARSIQGIGGAMLVPGSLSIIGASFSGEKRGRAFGTWSGYTSITAAIGPVIGGWLVEHVSWRAAFLINIPIAIAVLVIVFWHVPESRNEHESTRLDWLGASLATLGLGFLVYGLIESSRLGFNHFVLISISIGIVFFVIFLFVEGRVKHPMLPLTVFRSRNFSGSNLMTFFLYSALSGALFFFPLNLIQVQGYSATGGGMAFLPFILIMFLLSRWSGGLVERYGARLPLTIGPVIAAVGFVLFAIPEINKNFWTTFFPAIVVLGFGMAISVAPLTTTVMDSVPQDESGIASGINNAVARTAGLIAIAIFGILMLRSFNDSLDKHLSQKNISPAIFNKHERVKLAGMKLPSNMNEETKISIQRSIKLSFVSAFRFIMILAAIMALASALSSYFLLKKDSS